MKKIKSFFKKVFNLIVSLFLDAVDLIIYIFAVIALYQDDYTTALLLMLFGIAMEIRKGFKLTSEKNQKSVTRKALIEILNEMKEANKDADNEKNN